MESIKKLTYLQEVALKGEVSYTVSTCSHNAEMKLRMYHILKEVNPEYKPFLVQEFKNAVTFDEAEVDKVYYETLMERVPTWLWIEKTVEDIKTAIYLVPAKDSTALLAIDKLEERKKLIESAFIFFVREALMVCPDACEKLCNTILEDMELDFLHKACFYLRSCCDEVRDYGLTEDRTPEKILDCQFDIRNFLNFRIETDIVTRKPEDFKKPVKTEPKVRKDVEVIEINGSISQKELSDYISQKVSELFRGVTTKESTEDIKYVVKKVFTNTNITTEVKTCNTKAEAEAFIERIKREYPELSKTCEFIVCRARKNGKKS